MTILITAATGRFGPLAVESLLRRGVPASEIVAGGRDASRLAALAGRGVQTRHIDYDDPASLSAGLQGVDRVLFISGSEIGRRIPQHAALVKAAVATGVQFIAYTSAPSADTSSLALAADHQATEKLIKESGIPYALLRNGWYYENYTAQIPTYLEHGVILGAAGDGQISGASRADLAAAAAAVISTGTPENMTYELSADEAFTMADLAASVTARTGTSVEYRDLPEAELAAALEASGLPAPMATLVAEIDAWIRDGSAKIVTGDLHRLLGRTPDTMDEAVATAVKDHPST